MGGLLKKLRLKEWAAPTRADVTPASAQEEAQNFFCKLGVGMIAEG